MKKYDLIVAGGGLAGISAAVPAADISILAEMSLNSPIFLPSGAAFAIGLNAENAKRKWRRRASQIGRSFTIISPTE